MRNLWLFDQKTEEPVTLKKKLEFLTKKQNWNTTPEKYEKTQRFLVLWCREKGPIDKKWIFWCIIKGPKKNNKLWEL